MRSQDAPGWPSPFSCTAAALTNCLAYRLTLVANTAAKTYSNYDVFGEASVNNQRCHAVIGWRFAAAILGLALSVVSARAKELSEFNAAVEDAVAHQRIAIGYLRTDNIDLAALEIERAHASWTALMAAFKTPPSPFRDRRAYETALNTTQSQLATALRRVNAGQTRLAREALASVRTSLSALRRANGVEVLADCVLAANTIMDAFFVYHDRPPDWTKAAVRSDVADKAQAYGHTVKHCDAIAPAAVKMNAEFRRLVDGAIASLSLVPTAINQRDGDLLYRLLGELRAFDHLLAFRYG
jgi:hypothetical protein